MAFDLTWRATRQARSRSAELVRRREPRRGRRPGRRVVGLDIGVGHEHGATGAAELAARHRRAAQVRVDDDPKVGAAGQHGGRRLVEAGRDDDLEEDGHQPLGQPGIDGDGQRGDATERADRIARQRAFPGSDGIPRLCRTARIGMLDDRACRTVKVPGDRSAAAASSRLL